jgi:hypothetical protein
MKSTLVTAAICSILMSLSAPAFAAEGATHEKPEAAERDMNALFPQPLPNVTLSQRPEKPVLESPAFYEKIADAKVTLKWKEAAGATVYHVQVATDPNFKWLVKEESLLKGNTMEVSGLEGGKSYFWRVAGVKPENKAGSIQGVYTASMFEATAK